MLWTIAVILLVLWVLGLVTANTMGGFIHILIVLAIVVVLIRVITGAQADLIGGFKQRELAAAKAVGPLCGVGRGSMSPPS